MKTINRNMDSYLTFAKNNTNYKEKINNLKFYLSQLFNDIDLNNKNFLDIGGGDGVFSFFAAYAGAKTVVCLEPELDGSKEHTHNRFNTLYKFSDYKNVSLVNDTIQDYDPCNLKFDVILMNSSINHIDEEKCINLHKCNESKNSYINIFKKIYEMSNDNAILLISDCSKYNFFSLINAKNPFTPSIEWHKHQTPELWSELLKSSGFLNNRISWCSFNSLKLPGKIILGNKCCSYFLGSRFIIFSEKSSIV